MATCTHLDHVHVTELPEAVDGCEDCLADGRRSGCTCGSAWSAATSAAATTRRASTRRRTRATRGHPIIRSLEPGEDWSWCFVDELAMRIRAVQGETRIPPSPLLG